MTVLQYSKIGWTYPGLLYLLKEMQLPTIWVVAGKQMRVSEIRKAGLNLIAGQLVGVETIPMEIISYTKTRSTKRNVYVANSGPDTVQPCSEFLSER